MTTKKISKFKDILSHFDNAMLATRAIDGTLRSRPMRVADISENCDVWFVTDVESAKATEVADYPEVNVSMQDGNRFLSISGKATIVHDREKVLSLWNDAWKVWFPEGKDDPNIALLRVQSTAGEYWDMSGVNSLRYLLNVGKAYFSGETVEVDESMHAKVNL